MLKAGKFLHIRLSEIKSEVTFDTFASVYTIVVTHKFRKGGVSLTALE